MKIARELIAEKSDEIIKSLNAKRDSKSLRNSKKNLITIGDPVTIQVENCNTARCFEKALDYEVSSGQLKQLVENPAIDCYQNITFQCLSSPIQVMKQIT